MSQVGLTQDTDTWHDVVQLLDPTPFPCGRSRQTAQRILLGLHLVLISPPDGMPVIWGLGNPKLGERAITTTLVEGSRHLLSYDQVIIGDKSFSSKDFETFMADDLQATFVRPDLKDEAARFGNLGDIRRWIEPIFDTLKGQLGFEHHGARTIQRLPAKIWSKLLATATVNRPGFCSVPLSRSINL